jgi:hypothetical protein
MVETPGRDPLRARSAEEVIRDHLEQSRTGTVEDDLRRNYHPEVVCLDRSGVHSGHEAVRVLNERLQSALPGARLEYRTVFVHGELAFVEWTAASDHARVRDGADSYLIRDGLIVAQTIHYTVDPRREGGE